MTTLAYDEVVAEDLDEVAHILAHAFALPVAEEHQWFDSVGRDNLRVVRASGHPVGALGLIPMGQFFGGQSVAMTGIAGVGVRPDVQGRGVATQMMQQMLRELHGAGVALSALYGSTLSLYRKVGYETAGCRFEAGLLPQHIEIDDRRAAIRRPTPADVPRVEAFYRTQAAAVAGHLDRGPYIWRRIVAERFGIPAHGMLVEDDDGELIGYVFYRKRLGTPPYHVIEITDMLGASPEAWRRLWTFLRSLSTKVVEQIVLCTAPEDPGYLVHPNPQFPIALHECFMLRVANVQAAIAERGYPEGLRSELDLQLHDEDVPDNAGRWRLVVRDGQGVLEPGGGGDLEVTARGLAALYSGFASPWTLAGLGLLRGDGAACARAAAIFAGPRPWMREMF